MGALGFVSLGFAPGMFWLWLIVRRSRHRPEPRSLILRTFLLGVALAVPILFGESLLQGRGHSSPLGQMSAAEAAFGAFVVAGLSEELGKFWVVRASLRESPYLDDPLRGLIFSSAVALGFSSIETVTYMLRIGPEVIVVRAVLCTLGHVAFSSFWGAALGLTRQRVAQQASESTGMGLLALGRAGAIATHGYYDYFLMKGDEVSGFLTFLGGAVLFFVVLGRAKAASQTVHGAAVPLLSCRRCGIATPATASFCPRCGSGLAAPAAKHCGGCDALLPSEAEFCPSCGRHVQV